MIIHASRDKHLLKGKGQHTI